MKKLFLLTLALIIMMTLKAQWTDNAANNTSVANCSGDDSEIYTSTDPNSGYTYVQWNAFGANGWSPHLQCLSFNGTPKWGKSGIHISAPSFTSWSDGYAMAATSDGGVVSAFHTAEGNNYAVKINADGSFPWGEQGIVLFDGQGGDRAEVIAGNDGGVWTLGSDFVHSYLQYIHADGTMGPTTVISDPSGANCMFGQLTLSYNNNVLLTYEKLGMGKEIYVVGVTPEGELFNDGTLLMSSLSFQSTYIHSVVPDGHGGGFTIIYTKSGNNPYFTTIEAVGMDLDGNQLWTRTMCSTLYRRTLCQNSTGFHLGQNVVAWINCVEGGLYAQNIGTDGTMGQIEPIIPVLPCLAPENFAGNYVYNMEEQWFGTQLSWVAPANTPLH